MTTQQNSILEDLYTAKIVCNDLYGNLKHIATMIKSLELQTLEQNTNKQTITYNDVIQWVGPIKRASLITLDEAKQIVEFIDKLILLLI
jgi:hypothetical protein